jgi:hypothetical protein
VEEGPRPVCTFLIPVVRDSDRRPHSPLAWRLLQNALVGMFGAVTGPEAVLYYRAQETVPGAWRPEEGKEPVEDLSRKYTVAVPAHRVDELRALLRRAGNSFDQRVMYLEVGGYAELLEVRPEDGFLEM